MKEKVGQDLKRLKANWLLQNKCKAEDIANIALVLQRVIDVTKHQDWTSFEVAGGKLYAIATKVEYSMHNYGNALRFGQMAQAINEKAGVKTLVAKLQKQLQRQ